MHHFREAIDNYHNRIFMPLIVIGKPKTKSRLTSSQRGTRNQYRSIKINILRMRFSQVTSPTPHDIVNNILRHMRPIEVLLEKWQSLVSSKMPTKSSFMHLFIAKRREQLGMHKRLSLKKKSSWSKKRQYDPLEHSPQILPKKSSTL